MSKRRHLLSKAAPWHGSARCNPQACSFSDLSFVETHDCFTVAELIDMRRWD